MFPVQLSLEYGDDDGDDDDSDGDDDGDYDYLGYDDDENGAQLIQALPIQVIVTKICTQPRRIDINFQDNLTKDEILMKMLDTQGAISCTLVQCCTCVSVDMMLR